MDELDLCKHCGASASYSYVGLYLTQIKVICDKCGIQTPAFDLDDTGKQIARETWNRRKQ